MLPLTKEERKSYQEANVYDIYRRGILDKFDKNKHYQKVRDHCHYTGKYRGAAYSICNLKFNVPNETPVVFQRGSNYDYHFIIKELANDFEGGFECFGENKEKYKTFSVSVKKRIIKIDKEGNESVKTILYKIKFIDSARLMASSLSNLVDKLTERIHKIKCKDCDCSLEYESVKGNFIKCKRLSCNKDYSNKLDEELKKKLKITFKFSNNDINQIILLKINFAILSIKLKGVYPYKYMDHWKKFNEATIPEKKEL